ncbi:hypothetical protein LEP1GSC120_0188 [Leptospira santarosai str. 200702252]|nr:hypothetical protein LEP1GSC120_0188 [Leptospira santarosai str. 200702252]
MNFYESSFIKIEPRFTTTCRCVSLRTLPHRFAHRVKRQKEKSFSKKVSYPIETGDIGKNMFV